ncbi:MAG: diaminopimelate epimerase [Saprospiraceae bacterium]
MKIPFYKYQGTGNDFVLINNWEQSHLSKKDTAQIRLICDRRFGIGADGLILLQAHPVYDFEMIYFNADGNESSMCGNGGRCIVAFAHHLGLIGEACRFLAIDGVHEALVKPASQIELKMSDVASIEVGEDYYLMDTGSPHFVTFVEDIDDINVVEVGSAIRYSKRFREAGVNVNFVEKKANGVEVATYERGGKDETLSCGTSVTAAAITDYLEKPNPTRQRVAIKAKGGVLEVRLVPNEDQTIDNIWLCGKASLVFTGDFLVPKTN